MRPPTRAVSPIPVTPAPNSHRSRHSRPRSRRAGPLFSTICFCLLALHWILLGAVAIYYVRPHTHTPDYIVAGGAGCIALALFYLWVAYAVYKRRSYIFNIAITCASFWLLGFPTGTLIAGLVIGNLISARHAFTR